MAKTASGIAPLDERLEGLERGGTYLWAGAPGPAKLVAVLQFLHAGLAEGERCLLLTSAKAQGVLDVARAWGFPLEGAWREGQLEILGFRDDFEMRVLRSMDPEDAMEELSRLVPPDVARVAVDPGSMFLGGGARSLIGRAFMDWAQEHPATVWATLSVEATGALPSSAEWLVQDTSGVFLIERHSNGLFQVRMHRSVPSPNGGDDAITLQLDPGRGLVAPERVPSRRRSDRPVGDPNLLLLVSLGQGGAPELEAWAKTVFRTQVVGHALEAVARLQGGTAFGGILVHASRSAIRDAVRVCRAIRPLTGAAIVVTTDDAVRSTDRVDLLEAGADDCLSGGVDYRELAARIRQAIATGGKRAVEADASFLQREKPRGGLVPQETLAQEAGQRAADPLWAVFSLVRLGAAGASRAELTRALENAIRDEEGDMVACGPQECLVLLQGARREPAQAFLIRVAKALTRQVGNDPGLHFEVLVNPGDGDRIRELIASRGASGEKVRDLSLGGARAPSV